MKPRFQTEWEGSSEDLCIFGDLVFESDEQEFRLRGVKSSRQRAVEERFEGEKCLSQSSVGGKRRRAECHLRKGGGQGKGKRLEC